VNEYAYGMLGFLQSHIVQASGIQQNQPFYLDILHLDHKDTFSLAHFRWKTSDK
jgi:hypothetical protein